MTDRYAPPYRITPAILHSIEQIGEALGKLRVGSDSAVVPVLRRGNRIRTVQASLAIEGNTLSLEQVTAVLAGKKVLAQPREIQEVRNAFAAYEKLPGWVAHSRMDLLAAHGLVMAGLADEAGRFRSGGVGIQRGGKVIHVAPPSERVPALMDDLLAWLEETDEHPLVVSCVFHYELEFIHPFDDGNGRMGRLWQTLILSRWRPIFALLPVESIIRDRQQDYYAALVRADQSADATDFIDFMLAAILQAIKESVLASDQEKTLQETLQETLQKTPDRIIHMLVQDGRLSIKELAKQIGKSPSAVQRILNKLQATQVIERVGPDKGGHWVVMEKP
ncbi:MAG: Fic family protein [Syntrophales bacterium]